LLQERSVREPAPLFREVAAEIGLEFRHFTGAAGEYYLPEIMGAGVALLDYDSDGDLDVFLLQGELLDPARTYEDARFPPPPDHWPGDRLFRNELIPTGVLRFEDVTSASGLESRGYGMGAAAGDYDNDGDPDLYVTRFGSNALYRNDGDGTFSDVTRMAGVDDPAWSTSAAFVDYDRDGDLDLFVANYVEFRLAGNQVCHDPTGARDYCMPTAYPPASGRLFRNEGDGRFRDVSESSGIRAARGNGLGVTCADFDGDSWIDIYVANDAMPNHLWRNLGDGRFEEIALATGSAVNADGLPEASMGVTAGDFDSDGDEDLFMTHLARETNTLYVNDGQGAFRDSTNVLRLGSVSFPYTGFGAAWFDYDHDGWLDLFVANGAVTILESLRGSPYPFHQKNLLLRNRSGVEFMDVTSLAGPALDLSEVSRGAAFGDLDNDGDWDVVVTNNNGPARVLLNETPNANRWLNVRLVGGASNRDAYGARVALLREGRPALWRRVHTDGSYLSASDPRVDFGLGEEEAPVAVGVVWPDGERELWRHVSVRQIVILRQGEGQDWSAARGTQ
jgi:hypothetical protein